MLLTGSLLLTGIGAAFAALLPFVFGTVKGGGEDGEDAGFKDLGDVKPEKKVSVEGVTLTADSDPEVLLGVVARLAKRQHELLERGDDLNEQMEKKVADLKLVKQALAELQAKGPFVPEGTDSELRHYVKGDKGVQLSESRDKEAGDIVFGLLDDPKPKTEWQSELQNLIEVRNIVHSKTRNHPKCDARIRRHLAKAPAVLSRAADWEAFTKIFNDSSGVGAEFIIDLGLPMMGRDQRLVGELEAQFPIHQMQTSTEILPYMTTWLRPFKHSPGVVTDPPRMTASDAGTTNRTISATGMSIRAQSDLDAEEDAILPIVAMLQENGPVALAAGFEDCMVNGDDVGAHQDAIASWDPLGIWGTGVFANDHRTTFQGFRNRALGIALQSADESANQTYAGMLGWRSKLKSPLGVDANILHVVSYKWILTKLLPLAQFSATFPASAETAQTLTGIFDKVAKSRIIVSEFMTDDLNVSGLFDNVTTTKSGVVTINKARFWVTQRMGNTVFTDVDITRQVRDFVFRNRKGLFSPSQSGEKNVYYAFNLL
jgi:hypothetical protein